MRIVLDTNAIIASIIKDSSSRETILNPEFDFFARDFSFDEIKKHKNEISAKAGIEDIDILLSVLFERIRVIPLNEYKKHIEEAVKIIGKADISDAPFIACALALKAEGIWTEDRHFLIQNKIKIFKTKDLLELI